MHKSVCIGFFLEEPEYRKLEISVFKKFSVFAKDYKNETHKIFSKNVSTNSYVTTIFCVVGAPFHTPILLQWLLPIRRYAHGSLTHVKIELELNFCSLPMQEYKKCFSTKVYTQKFFTWKFLWFMIVCNLIALPLQTTSYVTWESSMASIYVYCVYGQVRLAEWWAEVGLWHCPKFC